ncbi:hypothetical protein AHAT_06800 [Agarivorans sp. Toyoura001]|nr:hypothetical protein AHAT_06800 [Agarivorans sp. Toyoura001]
MRKMDKKRDKDIVAALTTVCEAAKLDNADFSWISHQVNYQRFPDSLEVQCVYVHQDALKSAERAGELKNITEQINLELNVKGIQLNNLKRQVRFSSEE